MSTWCDQVRTCHKGQRSDYCSIQHYRHLFFKCPCRECIIKMICEDNCDERNTLKRQYQHLEQEYDEWFQHAQAQKNVK